MSNLSKMCITGEQAFRLKEMGAEQSIANFVWARQLLPLTMVTNNTERYYYYLYLKNSDGSMIYLDKGGDYGKDISPHKDNFEYAAAYTADQLATMLNIFNTSLEYDDGGNLVDQNDSEKIIPYSEYVHAMGDQVLIQIYSCQTTICSMNERLREEYNK